MPEIVRGRRIFVKIWLHLALALCMVLSSAAGGQGADSSSKLLLLSAEFNSLNSSIRDRTIKKYAAKEQFRELIKALREEYYSSGGNKFSVSDWVFPLQGYGYTAIGGFKGNGYQVGGYSYFDGNRHTGHPSQDIFIRDRKFVSLDDVSKKPVRVLSVTGGVVVAVENRWDVSSALRGGKYIWIYDPTTEALLYYAHNSKLLVDVGALVSPGDSIAEVGRTGLNAHKRRSPTHLHLTYLSIVNGLPEPKNIYKELLNSSLL